VSWKGQNSLNNANLKESRDPSVRDAVTQKGLTETFIGSNSTYYEEQFRLIGSTSTFTFTFNVFAALLGPIWFGLRGIWNWAFAFVIFEAFAFVQIIRGMFGDLAIDERGRLMTVVKQISLRQDQLKSAIQKGSDDLGAFERNIRSLQGILDELKMDIVAAEDSRIWIILVGIGMLLLIKFIQGVLANTILERWYFLWLSDRTITSGTSLYRLLLSLLLVFSIYPICVLHYTFPTLIPDLTEFPTDKNIRLTSIEWIEVFFDYIIYHGQYAFDGIASGIRWVLDGLDIFLVKTPWVVTFLSIIILTGLSAGPRAALWTSTFLIYIGLVGLWDKAMISLALLGAAACISICVGIPLGLYCARRPKVYNLVRPIMDLMQTMPAFVYMIPVIAFFGTGKVSAVIITIIFGGTPVVRLTVLGMRGVPDSIREAVIAFGASKWYLLTKVDLPLAAPSIRAGVNQTILLSLATVVLASLIGAKGLGEDVLEALQYASVGQGMLSGFAILFLATILDRIIQGKRKDT